MRIRRVYREGPPEPIRVREVRRPATPKELERQGRRLSQNTRAALLILGMLGTSAAGFMVALNPSKHASNISTPTKSSKPSLDSERENAIKQLEEDISRLKAEEAAREAKEAIQSSSGKTTSSESVKHEANYPPSYTVHQQPEWAFKLNVNTDIIAQTEFLYDQAMASDLVTKSAPESGKRRDLLVALAIKESSLNPNAKSESDARGLMQIMQPALDDIKQRRGVEFTLADMRDPLKNAIAGTIYFDILLDYAQHYFPNEHNPENIQKIALLAYNAGTRFLSLHSQKGDTYEIFIERVAQNFNAVIGGGNSESFDEVSSTYGVPMRVLPGVKRYMDLRARREVPKCRISKISCIKIGDGLVYAELIPSIADNLHTPPPEWISQPERIQITAQRKLWTVTNDILSHLAGRLPGYSDRNHRTYNKRMRMRERVMSVLVRYNSQNNPEFHKLGIAGAKDASIPLGTMIIIPSYEVFENEISPKPTPKPVGADTN